MSNRWTKEQVEKLKKDGKIKDFKVISKPFEVPPGTRVGKHFKKGNAQKDFIACALLAWCQERGLVLYEEYNFNPIRRWRSDWCVEELRILVEYEGLMSEKSRHTTHQGFSGDAEKYNSAQALGWTVLRFSALTYTTVIEVLNKTVTKSK